jgi:hypothetical protein
MQAKTFLLYLFLFLLDHSKSLLSLHYQYRIFINVFTFTFVQYLLQGFLFLLIAWTEVQPITTSVRKKMYC